MQKPILCLMGPTASGKSRLALQLAEHLPLEIISVDSAMVYRGMDIGTAKPTITERTKVPHHLIDICDPTEIYSAGQFRRDALILLEKILQRGQMPLLVGGTMLYFQTLQRGLAALPVAHPDIRADILAIAQQRGWAFLYQQLQKLDPITAAQLHPHDHQRISRALEIYHSTGQTWTHFKAMTRVEIPYHFVNIALIPTDMQLLHQRIEQRWKRMLDQGVIEEVKQLYERRDLEADLPAMRAVGYRQIRQYLSGQYDLATLSERVIIATRQLAKRQMTWIRQWPNVQRIDCEQTQLVTFLLATITDFGINP